MANGLLGKKVVDARDTEVVYTVPSSRTTTMNINILNDGPNDANVNVFISDKDYQAKDFEDYISPKDYVKTWIAADTANTLDLIGTNTQTLLTALKTTPVEPASANTASNPIAAKEIFTYQTATTVGNLDVHFAVSDTDNVGNPLPFYNGTELYVRAPHDGGVYTLTNYVTSGGSATTAASNYGMTATDNILWATNQTGAFAMAYVQGVPGAAGSLVNTIADYRANAATYNTAFTWGLGSISKIAGVKTAEERFIVGTSTGFNYISNDNTPEAQNEFTSNSMSPPTGVSGYMIGAAAIEGSTTNEGNLFIAYSGGKVAYAAYTAAAPFPTTGYSVFDFPAGVSYTDVIDIRAEGNSLVIVVSAGKKHSTTDLGVTWTESKHYAKVPVSVGVSSIDGSNRFVDGQLTTKVPEWTFVRGRTYRFHQTGSSNNNHPMLFSSTSGGPHSSGTAYESGVTYYVGDSTSTSGHAQIVTTAADYETHFEDATYASQPKIIEWTVPSDAPDTLYTYCPNHNGMGWAFSIVDEETTAPHDDATLLVTATLWNESNGDANRRYDLMFNGELYMREKRFFELPQADKYEKAEIASGEILERTAIMASQGEQVIVTTDQDDIIVRIHGIEE